MDDGDLMRVRLDTSFTYDGRGRMLRDNDPDGRPAPRLILSRTARGCDYRLGHVVPDDLARRLGAIIAREPVAADLRVPPVEVEALRAALAALAPIVEERSGPAYRFPDALVRPREVVSITADDAHLVQDTFPWVADAGWQPCFAVVHDGAAVSVCFSARIGARVAEAGVETLPEFRGRGHAAAVTAAWGAALRERGIIPLYSTAWDNLASQGVARRVGLTMYGVDMRWM